MVFAWERLEGRSGHEAGRQLLAQLYRREIGGALPEILSTPQGKPYFADNSCHFSISHTKSHVFCCLSRRNIGIDAENGDRNMDLRLAYKLLSSTETALFHAAQDKQATLLRLWVLKEAYAKLCGKGWGSYLYRTNFDPEDPRIRMIDGCYVAILEDS